MVCRTWRSLARKKLSGATNPSRPQGRGGTFCRLVKPGAPKILERQCCQGANFSPAQICSTGWRSRTTADCLPLTKTSVAKERVL